MMRRIMSTSESIDVLLAARAAVYRILQNLLGNEPSVEALEQLVSPASREVLYLFASDGDCLQSTLDALFSVTEDGLKDEGIFIDRLADDFTHLFVGPGKMEADPWESLHTSRENVLFQPSTLEVRKAYVAQGFIPQSYPHVADDHIALELDFMAQLGERLSGAHRADDGEKAQVTLVASRDFLDAHLLVWVSSFADRLAHARRAGFYGRVGAVLAAFLPVDREALDEMEGFFGEVRA
jgi:TorA maturation chaperone TorD